MPRKYLPWSFVNKFHDLTRHQKNEIYCNLEITFQKKVNFSQEVKIYSKLLTDNFPNLCPRGFNEVYVNKVLLIKALFKSVASV